MKVTGTRSYVRIDLENGYVMKAQGEMLVGRKFVVYKDTMKFWEPPHEKEEITPKQIDEIIAEIQRNFNENRIQLLFV